MGVEDSKVDAEPPFARTYPHTFLGCCCLLTCPPPCTSVRCGSGRTHSFPPATNKDKFGDAIISFCYPDIYTRASMKPDKKSKNSGHCETFSFVLTDTSAGKR
jgi:uDENN domain